MSHSPHPEANTPLSPAGFGSLLFSFVILFCPNGRSDSELGSHPTGPAPSFSSLGCSLSCSSLRGSLLGLPSSLHLVLPARCVGPAGLELPGQGGQQIAKPSPQWMGIQTAWVSPPVGIRHKTPRAILKHSREKRQMHSMGGLCPASTFISNKSALKMYDKKKELGKSLSWKPVSPTLSHFPTSTLHSPRESPQPCNTTSKLNSPHSHPSLLQDTVRCRPGPAGWLLWLAEPTGFLVLC